MVPTMLTEHQKNLIRESIEFTFDLDELQVLTSEPKVMIQEYLDKLTVIATEFAIYLAFISSTNYLIFVGNKEMLEKRRKMYTSAKFYLLGYAQQDLEVGVMSTDVRLETLAIKDLKEV